MVFMATQRSPMRSFGSKLTPVSPEKTGSSSLVATTWVAGRTVRTVYSEGMPRLYDGTSSPSEAVDANLLARRASLGWAHSPVSALSDSDTRLNANTLRLPPSPPLTFW